MIASCGHYVEYPDDLYTLYQIYYDVNENGETTGVISSSECKECFDKAIEGGCGYRTEQEVWDEWYNTEDDHYD